MRYTCIRTSSLSDRTAYYTLGASISMISLLPSIDQIVGALIPGKQSEYPGMGIRLAFQDIVPCMICHGAPEFFSVP